MLAKFNFKYLPSVNRVVKFFIISDLILWAGWGFTDPLFSIFVIQKIEGATVASIGYLAAIYWATRAIAQIPISLYLDKTEGEKDDFYALIIGLLVTGLAAFAFITAQTIGMIYFIQFVKAIGFSMYISAWSAIFVRHIDKNHSAFELSLDGGLVSLGIGLAGFLSGLIAGGDGFRLVFLITGSMAIISAVLLLFVPDLVLPRKTIANPEIPGDHIRSGLK